MGERALEKKSDAEIVLSRWKNLSDAEKLAVLPTIFDATPDWKNWAFSENGLVNWLRLRFEQSRIPFPL